MQLCCGVGTGHRGRRQGGTRCPTWARRSLVCVVPRERPPPLTRVSDMELLHSGKLLLSHCRGWESQRAQGRRWTSKATDSRRTSLNRLYVYACLSPRPTKSSTQKTSPTLPSGTITVHHAGLGLRGRNAGNDLHYMHKEGGDKIQAQLHQVTCKLRAKRNCPLRALWGS